MDPASLNKQHSLASVGEDIPSPGSSLSKENGEGLAYRDPGWKRRTDTRCEADK